MPNQFSEVIEKLGRGFEQFKEKHSDDLRTISDRLDQIETRSNRAAMGDGLTFDSNETSVQKEYPPLSDTGSPGAGMKTVSSIFNRRR
ncbi:MAG: hypothetical protein AB2777_17560 [Candidatus Thiodiazotropha endolucinida]